MALIPVQHRVTRFWPAFFGGVFLFCAFAVLVVFVFRQSISSEGVDAERARQRADKLAALRKEDQSRLEDYKWIDKAKGTVQIPVARAMELVATELNQQKPRPSDQTVEVPYPMGLADAPRLPRRQPLAEPVSRHRRQRERLHPLCHRFPRLQPHPQPIRVHLPIRPRLHQGQRL